MSGSFSDEIGAFRRGEISHLEIEYLLYGNPYMVTGSHSIKNSINEKDDLWERMYVRPKPVIIVCGACKSHNVVSSPTCVQCGAPMGWGKERVYE